MSNTAVAVDDLFARCANIPADETVWHEFFKRFQHSVDTTIYHLLNGRHTHLYDDVIQNFYARLLENDRQALRSFRGKSDAEARVYLCRIAARIAIDILRKEPPPSLSLEEQKEDSPNLKYQFVDTAAFDENYLALRESIDACIEKSLRGPNKKLDKLIFKLAIYDGLSSKQISNIEGINLSRNAVDIRLTRLRTKLRRELERK